MYQLTQREQILKALQNGPLNSYTATYDLHVKQAPTRIKELKEQGYTIESITKPNRSVDWILKPSSDATTQEEFIAWTKRRMEEADREERVAAGLEPQMEIF